MSRHVLSTSRAPCRTVSRVTAPTHCRSLQTAASVDWTSPLTSEESNGKQRGCFLCFYSLDLRLKQMTHSDKKSKEEKLDTQAAVALVKTQEILARLYLVMKLSLRLFFPFLLQFKKKKKNTCHNGLEVAFLGNVSSKCPNFCTHHSFFFFFFLNMASSCFVPAKQKLARTNVSTKTRG